MLKGMLMLQEGGAVEISEQVNRAVIVESAAAIFYAQHLASASSRFERDFRQQARDVASGFYRAVGVTNPTIDDVCEQWFGSKDTNRDTDTSEALLELAPRASHTETERSARLLEAAIRRHAARFLFLVAVGSVQTGATPEHAAANAQTFTNSLAHAIGFPLLQPEISELSINAFWIAAMRPNRSGEQAEALEQTSLILLAGTRTT